jgi:mono/diheme cytochrome c family protein
VDGLIASGDVHVIRNNRHEYVILSEERPVALAVSLLEICRRNGSNWVARSCSNQEHVPADAVMKLWLSWRYAMVRVTGLMLLCCLLAACSVESPPPGKAVSSSKTPTAAGGGAPADPLVAEGAELFKQFCVQCHGPQGNGKGSRKGPSLQAPALKYGRTPAGIGSSIRDGRPEGMPSFSHVVTPRQLEALTAYVMSLKP